MAAFTDAFQYAENAWDCYTGQGNNFAVSDYCFVDEQYLANCDVSYERPPDLEPGLQVYDARNIQWDMVPVETPAARYVDSALHMEDTYPAHCPRFYDGYVVASDSLPSHPKTSHFVKPTTPEQRPEGPYPASAPSIKSDQRIQTLTQHSAANSSELAASLGKIDCGNDPTPVENGLVPRRQEPRFAGDEYTAPWVRGEGYDRAGWCCKCSSWHKLKDSAYWYHMHYSHGISFTTGKPFDLPIDVRPSQGSLGHEALCGACLQWIVIGRIERWRTPYFRHAHKCQMKNKPSVQRPQSRSKSGSPRKLTPRPATPR